MMEYKPYLDGLDGDVAAELMRLSPSERLADYCLYLAEAGYLDGDKAECLMRLVAETGGAR